MDKKELERRLEAAEKQNLGILDEIKNLKAQLAEMQDEPEIPDFPEFAKNETYCCAGLDLIHVDLGCAAGGTIYGDYNCFHTKEMAQEFADKCKLIAMMLHCKWYLDRDYVPDWKNSKESKCFVFYDNCAKEFGVTIRTTSDVGYVAFSTMEKARKCADWLNKHWRKNDEESV